MLNRRVLSVLLLVEETFRDLQRHIGSMSHRSL
jgi:hypothetical protein